MPQPFIVALFPLRRVHQVYSLMWYSFDLRPMVWVCEVGPGFWEQSESLDKSTVPAVFTGRYRLYLLGDATVGKLAAPLTGLNYRLQLHNRLYSPSGLTDDWFITADRIRHWKGIHPENLINPFTPISSKRTFSRPFKEKCIREVVRVDGIIIFHLSKLWIAKFSILCYVYFWWGCRGNWRLITLGSERVKKNPQNPSWQQTNAFVADVLSL